MRPGSTGVISLNVGAIALLGALTLSESGLRVSFRPIYIVLIAALFVPCAGAIAAALWPKKRSLVVAAFFANLLLIAVLGLAGAFALTGLGGAFGLLFVIVPLLLFAAWNVFVLSVALQRPA